MWRLCRICWFNHKSKWLSSFEAEITGIPGHETPYQCVRTKKSLLGTINYLRNVLPDLRQLSSHLHALNKNALQKFVWTEGCNKDFMSIKKALCAGTILSPFNINFTTKLFIDYSNLGLGMALTQEDPDNPETKRLIWCSSHSHKSIKDSLLPPIYGECLALCWAIQQCRFWLAGAPKFYVCTDHKSLTSIFNTKDYQEMSDELAVYVRSTMSYNFEVLYVPGRKNQLADYLSRHPAWQDNDEGQDDDDPPFACAQC